jgi:hypothetical protein
MDIVEPSADDVGIRDAMALAGVSAKTLRRAVHAGELPRRYSPGEHGLQLVFPRAAVERWSAAHRRRRRAAAPPSPAPAAVMHSAVLDAVWRMNASLTRSRAAMADVSRQLEQHEQHLTSARLLLDRLTVQLASAGRDAAQQQDSGTTAAEVKGA